MMLLDMDKISIKNTAHKKEKKLGTKIMLSRLGALAINQADNHQGLTIINH